MNEQIGNKINDKTYIKLTPFKGFVLENFPFIEADFDAITNYQLLCKVIEYLNNVIANQNTVQELGTDLVNAYNSLVDAVNLAINEFETDVTADINQFKVDINNDFDEFTSNITTQFNNLKNYVDNYFDNNFPQLVSDKLDEMAEDGTLENLLDDYAHLTKTYNTHAEMIADSSTFTNGLKLKTLGYYTINDGGGAEYYVSNTSNNNVYQETLSNSLYLNLVIKNNNLNLKTIGLKEDENDQSSIFNKAIDFVNQNIRINIIVPKGTYNINQDLHTIVAGVNIIGETCGNGVTEERATIMDNRTSGNYLISYTSTNGTLGGNIENITFYDSVGTNKCIYLRYNGYSSMLKNLIFRYYTICICVQGVITTRIDNCNFFACGSGVANSEDYAIVVNSGSDTIISNCSSDHTRFIINCLDSCYGVLKIINNFFEISNNKIVKGKAPIYLNGQNSVIVTGNTFININAEFWKTTFGDANYNSVPYMVHSTTNTYLTLNNNTFQTGTGSGGYETNYNNFQGRFIYIIRGIINSNIFNDCSYITQSILLDANTSFNDNYIMTRTTNYNDITNLTNNKYVIYNGSGSICNNNTYRVIDVANSTNDNLPRLFYTYRYHTQQTTNKNIDFNPFSSGISNCITYKVVSPSGLPFGKYHLKVFRKFTSALNVETDFTLGTSQIALQNTYKYLDANSSIKIVYDTNVLYIQIFSNNLEETIFKLDGLDYLNVNLLRDKTITTEVTGSISTTISA